MNTKITGLNEGLGAALAAHRGISACVIDAVAGTWRRGPGRRAPVHALIRSASR